MAMTSISAVEGRAEPFRSLLQIYAKHRYLMWEMARREVSDRYAGQVLGVFWAFWHPIFLIGLYIFVFAFVFKQKIGGTVELPLDYTAYLLAGIVPWLSVQDGIIKSCSIITANASLVKQTVFPLEILVMKSIAVSLLPQVVSLIVLIAYVLVSFGSLHPTYLLIPLLMGIQVIGMLGIAFLLAPLGAYFRDLKDIVQILATAGIYLLPIFYLPAWVPPLFRPVLYINPFSYLIWCYQDILYYGRFEHPWAWVVTIVLSLLSFSFGFRLFRKLKLTLGNLL